MAAIKPAIRPSTPADAPAICALFVERGMPLSFETRFLDWKYWQPRDDWARPRSFVVTRGNELIAHTGIVPGTYAWAGRRVATLQMIDWVARPGTGAGVALLKYIGHMSEALMAIGGGPETLRILPQVGFCPAGVATAYARPLFPMRIVRAGATRKLLPRLARALWRRSALMPTDGQCQARRLSSADLSQIATVLPRPLDGMAVSERTVGLFRYLLSCPTVPMQLFAIEIAGRVRGYFLLASVAGQARIADCWMESDDPLDWRALILCAIEQAQRDPHAAEVVMLASDRLLAEVLGSCGFYPRFECPIQVRLANGDTMPEGTLRVQMLDNDLAYLWEEGRNAYWG